MPSAIDIKNYSRITPSAFISPFSDKSPIALYSSIAIKGENDDDCLPCSITSLNRSKLQRFLIQLAEEKIIIPQNSISSTTQIPVIPPPPSGSLEEIIVDLKAEVGNFGVLRQITFERFDFVSSPIFWTLNAVPGTLISITNMIIETDGQQNFIDWGDGTTPIQIVSGTPISKTYT